MSDGILCDWCKSSFKTVDKKYSSKIKLLKFQDTELSHINADELLLEILQDLGFDKTIAEFKKLDKWYS